MLRILLIGIKNIINVISENKERIANIEIDYVDHLMDVDCNEYKKIIVRDLKTFG